MRGLTNMRERWRALLSGTFLCTALMISYRPCRGQEPAKSCQGVMTVVETAGRCIKPKETFKDCVQCPEMVVLPAGRFVMGSHASEAGHTSEEEPQHTVQIAYPFAAGKYEVTFAEWEACVAAGSCKHNPRDPGWGRGRRPVINVSWNDIIDEYLPWLSRTTGQTYRLLTEAEWEYAARSGGDVPFSTGATISSHDANFDATLSYAGGAKGEYRKRTLEVGSFPANAFGLHDMHGNVWEWVADCFFSGYQNAPMDGSPAAESPNCQRVMRGGSWIDGPRVLRVAARGRVPAKTRFIYRGFRVARKL